MKAHNGVVAVGFTVQADNGKAAEAKIRQLVERKLSGDAPSFEGVSFPIPPTARRWVLQLAPTRREYLALQHDHSKWVTRAYSLAKELRRLTRHRVRTSSGGRPARRARSCEKSTQREASDGARQPLRLRAVRFTLTRSCARQIRISAPPSLPTL
jgi:hypothetical protein